MGLNREENVVDSNVSGFPSQCEINIGNLFKSIKDGCDLYVCAEDEDLWLDEDIYQSDDFVVNEAYGYNTDNGRKTYKKRKEA